MPRTTASSRSTPSSEAVWHRGAGRRPARRCRDLGVGHVKGEHGGGAHVRGEQNPVRVEEEGTRGPEVRSAGGQAEIGHVHAP